MSDAVEQLRDPVTIRERARNIFDSELSHFEIRLDRLESVVETVRQTTCRRYPKGDIPVHGRLRHFGDRLQDLEERLRRLDTAERARTQIDLVIVSVLLDAGAGDAWRYRDPATGRELARSEGLAIASYDLFVAGAFSHTGEPRVTAAGLDRLEESDFARGFQVGPSNPLVGLSGRAALLRGLGAALREHRRWFGDDPRPGNLFDHADADALELFRAVMVGLSSIWPSRLTLDDEPLGDVWRHPKAGGHGPSAGFVPFHKLSQWLTYSLVEPFATAGRPVANIDALTGLAEYRNGGLFVDTGLLVPKHTAVTREIHAPESELVVEWRALTVILLDRVAEAMELPLSQVIEGGTWHAGRTVARELRDDGSPPIRVSSDGTLF